MYQPLSDDELDQYVTFSESPAGQKYAAASLDAIDKALTEAAVRLGQELRRTPRDLPLNPSAEPAAKCRSTECLMPFSGQSAYAH